MENSINIKINTDRGDAIIKEFYVTEMGYLMAKIYYPENKISVNYPIGDIKELLNSSKFNSVKIS